ncbi:hypothetical protein F4X73_06155 [Candidatus Poribacteria bacterium]|nr:hypothetical protein [Candidatus Poribacteria bacterium]MYB64254.1 hypothetical protein [Candidatus Poribacteria bacterium]
MKRIFVFFGIALVILLQLNCSSEQEKINNPTLSGVTDDINAAPLVEEVNLDSMYEDEVRKLATKTPVQLITVIEGTSKVIVEAEFRRVKSSGFGFPLYECVLTDEAVQAMGGLAQGMSGSPVGPPGKVFGALAYGEAWAAAPHRFWVTPIDAMEATLEHTTFGEFLNPAAAPSAVVNPTYVQVKTPMTITGIDNSRLEQLSSHLSGTRFDSVEFYSRIGGAPAATPANASPNLSAGDMIGVATVTGDVVNSIGTGTVTQVYGDKFVAFGHDMFLDGQVSLPVYRAVVDGIVANTRISYKSSTVYGNPIGTITKDLRPGIVGELGPAPSMIPVNVIYQPVNSPEPIRKRHKVAYGQESFIPIVAAATLDAIRMEVSPGTIEGNVVISFKETDNVYTESFRTITPDPFESVLARISGIIEPFTNNLINGAGRATIDEVNISMIDIPYILHAEITDIHVIGEVKQGEVATFVLEMLPHWTAAGRSRSMYREVKLPIPENFVPGPAIISMAAVTEYGFNPFSSRFPPSPASLNGFIKQLKDAQFDRGLVLVTLATLAEEPMPEEPSIEALFEAFFTQFFETLLENIPLPEDGELPPDNGELPPGDGELPSEDGELPDDGETVVEEAEMIIEEPMMEEIPSDTPITGTALIVQRFIVTGDTGVEVEVLPADVELDADAEDTTE